MSCGCEVEIDKERKAKVHLPSDGDMADFEIGDDVEILIKGKIVGGRFSMEKDDWEEAKGHLEVEVDGIEIEGKNIFESLIK